MKVADKRQKHTKMAQRPLQDLVRIANVANCDNLREDCERRFCTAAKAADKDYGGQIDRNTRRKARYQELLEQAMQHQKPPTDKDEWDLYGDDDVPVGVDIVTRASTTKYRVKTKPEMSGTVFTGTHLFPEDTPGTGE